MTDSRDAADDDVAAADGAAFDALLRYVHDARGFDFSGYKRGTLTRRISRRMHAVGASSYEIYTDLLQAEPAEVSRLLETIMINVTSFFRDAELWDVLRDEIIPALLEANAPGGPPVRVWSAGCADGREPYSLAMLFTEAVGRDQVGQRVKIYATDFDDKALAEARRAQYRRSMLDTVPEEYVQRYFAQLPGSEDVLVVDPELRRCVIFGEHNLVSDAPISRVDLLLCRNTLMYFDTDLQREVLNRFEFSLARDGFLVLGRVEMLLGHQARFEPVHHEARVFRKVSGSRRRTAPRFALAEVGSPPTTSSTDLAFEESTVAQVILDTEGTLVAANAGARSLFGLQGGDLERQFSDLELSFRPVDLRPPLAAATLQREQVTVKDVELVRPNRTTMQLDVIVTPLQDDELLGMLIAFIDVTRHHDLRERLQEARHELEAAYQEVQTTNEELETTNEELQSTNEELETTNEELQSTIEELETTNEELRSTNEEFETMNDELRSVNDKLAARNRALRERTAELAAARRYFSSILDSFDAGVIVVDRSLNVLTWSSGAEELWGLRADEAQGQLLLGLDIGLPVHELAEPVRTALAGPTVPVTLTLNAHNRRGQPIGCTVHCSALREGGDEALGVVLRVERTQGSGPSDGAR